MGAGERMARDWVKLHVGILDDPRFGQLSPEAGWMWTRFLALAGRNEDSGRLGTVDQIAWVLHTTPEAVADAVSQLNGWITERDGQLCIRDWSEWQPASGRERWRKWADAHADEQTDANDNKREQTPPNVRARARVTRPDQTRRELDQTNNTTHASGARWDVLTDAMVADGLAVRSENGKAKAQAGVVAGLLGPVADNDPDGAVELWRRFVSVCRADGSWQYVTGRNVGERVGKWLAGRSGAKRAWTLTGGGK